MQEQLDYIMGPRHAMGQAYTVNWERLRPYNHFTAMVCLLASRKITDQTEKEQMSGMEGPTARCKIAKVDKKNEGHIAEVNSDAC